MGFAGKTFGGFRYFAARVQWIILAGLSLLFVLLLEAAGISAGWLLGPIIAGIIMARVGMTARIEGLVFDVAQAFVGCLIAQSLTPAILAELWGNWPLFLGIIFCIMMFSWSLGWLLARWQVVPGSAAIWGSSPGAASAMTLMSIAYGADVRLVAFMQYVRVLLVVIASSFAATFWSNGTAVPDVGFSNWFSPGHWPAFIATSILAVAGAVLGRRFKVPAGSLLIPMIAGAVLHGIGIMNIEIPQWVLIASYCIVGWAIGLRFNGEVLKHSLKALPGILISNLILISLCGSLAFLLSRFFAVDPLTAYLATSPGGANTVAIIAVSTNVDVSFVMALQTGRMLLVVLLGPIAARFMTRRIASAAESSCSK
ncbi:MAG: uncharacterized protein PWQ29_1719 [Verrucomicrobiota bacterium]|jgi:membrane AbrB-like protein|nr:uncharacterized protein [Verrucomicrobiota bacterium]MDK2964325.1 uncharacterized protein [Verrucomicrobiota bacterium]